MNELITYIQFLLCHADYLGTARAEQERGTWGPETAAAWAVATRQLFNDQPDANLSAMARMQPSTLDAEFERRLLVHIEALGVAIEDFDTKRAAMLGGNAPPLAPREPVVETVVETEQTVSVENAENPEPVVEQPVVENAEPVVEQPAAEVVVEDPAPAPPPARRRR